MSAPTFTREPVPDFHDTSPQTDDTRPGDGDFDPAYPGSTPDAPYGYFANGNPRKRRPKGTGQDDDRPYGVRGTARTSQATAAASLLARMNGLLGLGLASFGMPLTAQAMVTANEQFEIMAREALMTDPALCKVILSGGVSSGKAGLIMAYGALGIAMLPAAQSELRQRRITRAEAADMEAQL